MDSRAYASLTPGMETAEELDACTLLVNSQVCVQTIALILRTKLTCDVLSRAPFLSTARYVQTML